MKGNKIREMIGMKKIEEKLYCARCGKILHPHVYINNLKHSIVLNKEHLLSFCDDCIEKANLEFANGKSFDFPKKEIERK